MTTVDSSFETLTFMNIACPAAPAIGQLCVRPTRSRGLPGRSKPSASTSQHQQRARGDRR
jgi:hypothetical protein